MSDDPKRDEIRRRFGALLRKVRDENKMSQGDISKTFGVHGNNVSNWEKGSALPSLTNFLSLHRLLGITLDDFAAIADSVEVDFDES